MGLDQFGQSVVEFLKRAISLSYPDAVDFSSLNASQLLTQSDIYKQIMEEGDGLFYSCQ